MNMACCRRASLRLPAFAAFALGAVPAGAAEPSFDCENATLPVEHLICANAELAGLDEMLARSYAVAVERLGDAGICLRADQSRWLRDRRNACGDEACVQQAYRYRLSELNPLQFGASFVKDVPEGPELVAAVPPTTVEAVDLPDNPDPEPMAAEGEIEEHGGGYVLTAADGAHFVMQNAYFGEAMIEEFNRILVAADERTRFRVNGYRAALAEQNVFEPRRCIMVRRLPD